MTRTRGRKDKTKLQAPARAAEIVREYGPFAGADSIAGVTHDGRRVWAATGARLIAFDPESGQLARTLDRAGDAGTAFDGTFLYQIAESRIDKIDPATGDVVASIPAPGHGGDSGLAWAEGSLWVGQYRDRKIYQIDPETGDILRTIESNRFVTGVTWVDGELWHATWEGDESDLRRVDPRTGEVLERLEMPPGVAVSGLESDGGDLFFCEGGRSGKRAAQSPPPRAFTFYGLTEPRLSYAAVARVGLGGSRSERGRRSQRRDAGRVAARVVLPNADTPSILSVHPRISTCSSWGRRTRT